MKEMLMRKERWQKIKSLYAAAREVPKEQREDFLGVACAGESDLRDEVLILLQTNEHTHPLDKLAEAFIKPIYAASLDSFERPHGIESYEILEEIGRGGMGVVYKAMDRRLRRHSAIKILSPYLITREDAKHRFITEARTAGGLDHPNICTIYEIGESEEGQLFISMPFYHGETLKQRLSRGIFSYPEAIEIIVQAAEGIQHAHSAGVVHRDIKPANLFITETRLVKILDFGIAKLSGAAGVTRPGVRVGTASYMSPEQIKGESIDQRIDIWSLGVVLYEMLSGVRPFEGANEISLMHAILEQDPVSILEHRPDLPPQIEDILRKTLAKDPSSRYQQAHELIRDLKAAAAPVEQPYKFKEFPLVLTSLEGREREIMEIRDLLKRVRLLTLTGPGGVGKTRLSQEIMRLAHRDFPDGTVFVTLAHVSDPGLVASEIAHGLGIPETPARSVLEGLKRALFTKSMLLILDNFEHIQSAAPVVTELLAACPQLKILVTSRIPVRIAGEQEYPVSALEIPDLTRGIDLQSLEANAAVRLFLDRARASRPNFNLTGDNAESIAQLCARLDGLPLALELAAARIKLFTPEAMLGRLDHVLDLFRGTAPGLSPRHQTLRQTIEWSYHLLDDREETAFRHLSVFSGGFTLDAAGSLLGTGNDDLQTIEVVFSLIDKSLLLRNESSGSVRFRMLETVRTYALEQLYQSDEAQEIRRQHALYYLHLTEQADAELTSGDQATWLTNLRSDLDNIRAALIWAEENAEGETGQRLGTALLRFWITLGYLQEGYQWLERMLAIKDPLVPDRVRARTLNGIGTLSHELGNNLKARTLLEESLRLWRAMNDAEGVAQALNNLGWVACELSEFELGQSCSKQALEMCRSLGSKRGLAVALNNLGWVENYRGNYPAALALFEESLFYRREAGDRRGIAFALCNVAWAEIVHGNYARAELLLKDAEVTIKNQNDKLLHAWLLLLRGMSALDRKAFATAVEYLDETLMLNRESGQRSGVGWALLLRGMVAIYQHRLDLAEALILETTELFTIIGCRWGNASTNYLLGLIEQVRGRYEQAGARFRVSLASWQHLGSPLGCAECIENIAEVEVHRCRYEYATQLLAKASAIRNSIQIPIPPRRSEGYEWTINTCREKLDARAFHEAWAVGERLSLEASIQIVDSNLETAQ